MTELLGQSDDTRVFSDGKKFVSELSEMSFLLLLVLMDGLLDKTGPTNKMLNVCTEAISLGTHYFDIDCRPGQRL